MTRGCAAFRAFRDLGRLGDARVAWKTGTYPEIGLAAVGDAERIEELSNEMLRQALQ